MIGEEIAVVPATGEAIDISDAATCARMLQEMRDLEGKIRDFKRLLTEQLIEESRRQGTKTLHLPGIDARINQPPATIWDYEVLCELQSAGLPEERFNELVTMEVSYKVNGNIAKSIAASNDEYRSIIERAKETTYGQPTVSIIRG